MLAGGLIAIYLGKELSWDLANYHYYNPYAFIHHRETLDYWPTSFIHQYICPTLDLFFYFLITTFPPKTAVFLIGSIHGINFWLLFLIARCFLTSSSSIQFAFIFALLGMYGPTALPGIGSLQGDEIISIFILGFILLQIKQLQFYLKNNVLNKYFIFFGGLLLGIGAGLKLTAGLFVLSGVLAYLIFPFPWRHRLSLLFIYCVGVTLGMLAVAGYWMVLLWQHYHNPVFPFLNNIFKSSDFPAANWTETRFLPQGILQTLFFPFYFSLAGQAYDTYFRDFRFAFVYIFFVLFAISAVWTAFRKKTSYDKVEVWLFLFYIFSFVIWEWYFSIMRYAVTLEMLSPLIIYLLARNIFQQKHWRLMVLIPTYYLIFLLMVPIGMVRAQWYSSDFFNVKMPAVVNQTPNASVLIAYPAYVNSLEPRPQSYLIPFFPSNWRFIGVPFNKNVVDLSDRKVRQHIATLINENKGPLFLLASKASVDKLYHSARQFDLIANGKCEKILSERQAISLTTTWLCPVKKNNMSS